MFPEQLTDIASILHFGGEGLSNIEHYKTNSNISLKKISEVEYILFSLFFFCHAGFQIDKLIEELLSVFFMIVLENILFLHVNIF